MNRMLTVLAVGVTACAHRMSLPAVAPTRLTADIDTVLARFAAVNGSPGLGVVVVRDTQIVYLKGAGYADAERRIPFDGNTEFYIASTTKAFTGLAAAILAQRGVWNLDAPVSRYLPELRLKDVEGAVRLRRIDRLPPHRARDQVGELQPGLASRRSRTPARTPDSWDRRRPASGRRSRPRTRRSR